MPNGLALSAGLLVAALASCATTSTRESISPSDYEIAAPAPTVADSSHAPTSGPSESSTLDLPAAEPTTTAGLLGPAPTFYEDYKGPRNGRSEFTLSGAGSNDKEFNNGAFTIDAGFGRYISDLFEVGLRQSITYSDRHSHDWNGSTRVFADLNFGESDVIPFIGANFGGVYGDTVKDTFEAAPEGGVKWYLRNDVFVQFLVEYQFFFEKSNQADDAFEDGQFVYSLGLGFAH